MSLNLTERAGSLARHIVDWRVEPVEVARQKHIDKINASHTAYANAENAARDVLIEGKSTAEHWLAVGERWGEKIIAQTEGVQRYREVKIFGVTVPLTPIKESSI